MGYTIVVFDFPRTFHGPVRFAVSPVLGFKVRFFLSFISFIFTG